MFQKLELCKHLFIFYDEINLYLAVILMHAQLSGASSVRYDFVFTHATRNRAHFYAFK